MRDNTTQAPCVEELPDTRAPSPFEALAIKEAREALRVRLGGLERTKRMMTEFRYGLGGSLPHTLQGVADLYGLSRERVRGILVEALSELRWRNQGCVWTAERRREDQRALEILRAHHNEGREI